MKVDKPSVVEMSLGVGGEQNPGCVSTSTSSPLVMSSIPDNVMGLVREGEACGPVCLPRVPLPQAIVQITQPLPLSRSALSDGGAGVTALVTKAGDRDVTLTPVTLRSIPISFPARGQTIGSVTLSKNSSCSVTAAVNAAPLLDSEDIDNSDLISSLSANSSACSNVVFSQSHGREVPLESITLDSNQQLVSDVDISTAKCSRASFQYDSCHSSSTANIVTISQATLSLPVVYTTPHQQLSANQEALPIMMSSSMMPRDQMLSSNLNPLPKLMSIQGVKDHRGEIISIVD